MSSSEIRYFLTENEIQLQEKSYTGYGIAVKCGNVILNSIRDISANRQDVETLVEMCNRLELDPVHLEDIADDYLP